jgi:hypothetical protein
MHKEAIDDYTAALRLDAMSPDLRATALYNRGLSYQKSSNRPMAIEDFTSALFLKPDFAHAYMSRGTVLRESGQLLFAISDYERALRHNHPDVARVHFSEALTFEALKRPAEARKHLEAALAADPNYGPARQKLASLDGVAAAAPADAITTASVSSLGGGLVVRKPSLPKAVEPPAELQTASASAATAAPVFKKLAKKYTDRVPSAASEPEEKIVAIEEVPAIPEPESTPETTASISGPETVQPDPVVADAGEAPTEEPAAAVQEVASSTDGTAAAWSVQIASAASEDAAWSTFKKMQKRHKALGSVNPMVVKADLGTKGIFYRVRLGFDEQQDAKTACSKLKSKGIACFVSRTSS